MCSPQSLLHVNDDDRSALTIHIQIDRKAMAVRASHPPCRSTEVATVTERTINGVTTGRSTGEGTLRERPLRRAEPPTRMDTEGDRDLKEREPDDSSYNQENPAQVPG